MYPSNSNSADKFSNATFKPKIDLESSHASPELFNHHYVNASEELIGDLSSSEVDINEKYYLNFIVPVVWSLIIFLGILGNGLVIYIIIKRKLYKNSCTNCYIINVALADLCFTLICVPVTMTAYIYKEWIFGEFMCHFENLLMFSSVQATCLTLTAMTVDRYSAILYPFKSLEFRTTKIAIITNILIWIASFLLNTPYYMYYKHYSEGNSSSNATEHMVYENSTHEAFINSNDKSLINLLRFNISHANFEPETHTQVVYYCVAQFPNFKIEKALTIYTVIVSYALPVCIIMFCYVQMIKKFISDSSNDILYVRRSNIRKKFIFKSSPSPATSNFDCATGTSHLEMVKIKFKGLAKNDRRCSATIVETASLNELKKQGSNNNIKDETIEESNLYHDEPEAIKSPFLSSQTNKETKVFNFRNEMSSKSIVLIEKKKRKAIFLVGIVSMVFAVTWFPAHCIQIWKVVFRKSFPYSDLMYVIKVISHTLSYSNSLLNPLIYVFMGRKYQAYLLLELRSLMKYINCKCRIKRPF